MAVSTERPAEQRFLDPAVIARIGGLELKARTIVEVNSRYRTLAEQRAMLTVARLAQGATREKLREKTNQFHVQAALLSDVLELRAQMADRDDRLQQALSGYWTAQADYDLAIGEEGLQ